MANIEQNRKLMVENIKKVRAQLSEDKQQLNEMEFWDWVIGGIGIELGRNLLYFAMSVGILIMGGIGLTVSAIKIKINQLKSDYKSNRGAKEALEFLAKNKTIKEIQKLSQSLKDTHNSKIDKRTKDAALKIAELKKLQKELTAKRKSFAAKLIDEVKSANLSPIAVKYLADEIPYLTNYAYFRNRHSEY